MNGFKFYKNINGENINIKLIYDEYVDLGDNNYAPSRLRAVISGLNENYVEHKDRIGHKDFEIGRDELASKLGKTAVEADRILKEGEHIFSETDDYLGSDNPALLHLIKMVDNFLKKIEK
jgi:hypothetical protein